MVSLGFVWCLLKVGLRFVWGWNSVCLGLSRVGLGFTKGWFRVCLFLFNMCKVGLRAIWGWLKDYTVLA